MVTWNQLGGVMLILGGVVAIAGAVLAILAAGMSDAPTEAHSIASKGAGVGVLGLVLVAGGIWLF